MYLPDAHPDAAAARVTILVVALGRTARLVDCLASLVAHEARAGFGIVCVINPSVDDPAAAEAMAALPVTVVDAELNLGWSAGLHRARARTSTELMVWVQEDMVVLPGWLDALVDAAATHPEVGAFGSLQVDELNVVQLFNGGWAQLGDVHSWSATDTSLTTRPEGVSHLDWVTSRGLLVRATAWNDIGGPDPSLFPLTYVDLDTCTHLRAHGWGVALVADARVRHLGNRAAPGLLREYLDDRLTPRIDARWNADVALPRGLAASAPHDCTRERAADVEGWVASEAAEIVVQFGRWAELRRRATEATLAIAQLDANQVRAELAAVRLDANQVSAELATARLDANQVSEELAAVRASRSWRVTAPLRALRDRIRPSRGH